MIVPPITAADCVLYPSFDQLVREEETAGRGATVRAGVALARRTVLEIQTSCAAVVPNPTSYAPDPLLPGFAWTCFGTGFGGVAGQVHLGDASTWGACVIRHLQPVAVWAATRIDLSRCVVEPVWSEAWIYVLNQWGQRNANGLHCTILPE